MRKIFSGVILTVALLLAGCGSSVQNGSSSGSGQTGSSGSANLSSIGKTPDFSWHDSYLTGKHSSFGCGDTCHTPSLTAKIATDSATYQVTSDRKQICYQCHATNYNATSSLNHSAYGIGTYCNSCHYSDSFKTHSRVSADQYHTNITANCASCHSGRYPSSHATSGRTSGCESCHSYKNGSWGLTSGAHSHTSGCSSCHLSKKPASHADRSNTCETCHAYPNWNSAKMNHSGVTSGCSSCHLSKKPASHANRSNNCETCHSTSTWSGAAMNHSGVTSGCSSCHTKHYSGFSCEGCHTQGINWNFSHNRVSSSNCGACHDGNGEDGEDGEGGDDHEGGGDDDRV